MPDDDVKIRPLPNAPEWAERRFKDEDAPTMEEMRKARTRSYGQSALKKREDGNEEEFVSGIVVKHYN